MKSIKALFDKVSEVNPYWSSYICFAESITEKKFSRDSISRAFNKLVEKDDCPDSRKTILNFLVGLTKNNARGTQVSHLKSPTNDFYTKEHKSTITKKRG